jgi:hypothetical protein
MKSSFSFDQFVFGLGTTTAFRDDLPTNVSTAAGEGTDTVSAVDPATHGTDMRSINAITRRTMTVI